MTLMLGDNEKQDWTALEGRTGDQPYASLKSALPTMHAQTGSEHHVM